MVENAQKVQDITPPSLQNFIIVSGPNQETGMESTNGVTRQYIGLTYLLKPKNTGRFNISGALARADGKTLKGNSVKLEVTKNSSGNSAGNAGGGLGGFSPFPDPAPQSSFEDFVIKKGENVANKINKNIFIRVDMSKNSCYVGEPVIVTYKLYTRLKSESSITKNPSFNGFSVIDLLPPGNTYYNIEKLNGREYNVYTLRKSQLYPLQAGPVELESAEVENNIHFIKEEYLNRRMNGLDDIFGDLTQMSIPPEGMQDEKVTLQSKLAVINVKPLPEINRPVSFKGAVGNFSINASVEKNSFTTDDAGKLRITINGAGNMSLVIAPDLVWPDGIEAYEPKSKEQLNKFLVPVSGTKIFEYTFTVSKAGEYSIAPIAFSFFDTKENKYKTISTKPLIITVKKGSGKMPVTIKGDIVKTGKEQFFDTLFTNRWLIVVPVAILILTGLFISMRKENKKQARNTAKAEPAATAPVAEPVNDIQFHPLLLTEEKLVAQDTRGFYQTLNNELRKFLSDKFQVPLATLNKKTITEEADKKGISLYTTLQIQRLLDDIEWQLYTPYADEDKMQEMYKTADTIVHVLNSSSI